MNFSISRAHIFRFLADQLKSSVPSHLVFSVSDLMFFFLSVSEKESCFAVPPVKQTHFSHAPFELFKYTSGATYSTVLNSLS